MIDNLLKVGDSSLGGDNSKAWDNIKKLLDGARVVWFGMIGDEILDVSEITNHILDVVEVAIKEWLLNGLNKNSAFLSLDKISVVSGTIGCFHDNIEDSKVAIESAKPVDSVAEFLDVSHEEMK